MEERIIKMKARLGQLLIRERLLRGQSVAEAAETLQISNIKVSRIECAYPKVILTLDDVMRIFDYAREGSSNLLANIAEGKGWDPLSTINQGSTPENPEPQIDTTIQ